MEIIVNFLAKNGLITAFLLTGAVIYASNFLSDKVLNKKIPGTAVAIILSLIIAYVGGVLTGGKNGIADIKAFSGFSLMAGPCCAILPSFRRRWARALS